MIVPSKLKRGDGIRVIAPARSLSLLSEEIFRAALDRLGDLGFRVSFSEHAKENDMFMSSSVASRVEDIHAAFRDTDVKGILTVIGGFNSNQLLDSLDYDLIRENPKVLCGFSDITALCNAITAKTGLVTYSGPHFSTFAIRRGFEYDLEYFSKCLMEEGEYRVEPSERWSDDAWYLDQESRDFIGNEGYAVLNPGRAEGRIVGGNLCTLNLLHGTPYMPDLSGAVLFLEDDGDTGGNFAVEFDRNLQSLIHQPGFDGVRGVVIGRPQKSSNMNTEKFRYIIGTKEAFRNIPVVVGADFGHTDPLFTFPIGGTARLVAGEGVSIFVTEH
ncbi:MAG: LD-carboxypeptidase [Candidatus Moranbacteria bacterium]|nr:LD-carboxypeptidase [Candidatus Moranbacteria bacterium]